MARMSLDSPRGASKGGAVSEARQSAQSPSFRASRARAEARRDPIDDWRPWRNDPKDERQAREDETEADDEAGPNRFPEHDRAPGQRERRDDERHGARGRW